MHGLPAKHVGDIWVCVGCAKPKYTDKKWHFNSPGRRGCLCATSEYGLFIYSAKIIFAFWFLPNWWYIRLDRSMDEWIRDIINRWSFLILRFYQKGENVLFFACLLDTTEMEFECGIHSENSKSPNTHIRRWSCAGKIQAATRMQRRFSHALVGQCVCARAMKMLCDTRQLVKTPPLDPWATRFERVHDTVWRTRAKCIDAQYRQPARTSRCMLRARAMKTRNTKQKNEKAINNWIRNIEMHDDRSMPSALCISYAKRVRLHTHSQRIHTRRGSRPIVQ